MAIFKPVMVQNREKLNERNEEGKLKVGIIPGQYIVVIDENELYLDKDINGVATRVKVSQNIYIQPESDEPDKSVAKIGDVWFVTEEETSV